MVEVQSIKINDLCKNGKGGYEPVIKLSPKKQQRTKNLASESELHRILLHLDKEINNKAPEKSSGGYTIIPAYFTLDVGKNVKRYDTLIKNEGKLTIVNMDYELDGDGNPILESKHYKLKERERQDYMSTFCGAGHSRTQKNLFIRADIIDKLNDILLCGMSKDMVYDRPSKWNAYYAMVTTDSTPVSYTPNIVVIDDYEKIVYDDVNVVEVSGVDEDKVYTPLGCRKNEPISIIPFDGAGLVTPECAKKWSEELQCVSTKGKKYIPSCFQFRAIPGIKGELMVFDLKTFAEEHNVSKIKDLGGREWDLTEDKIDVVMTKSQFKFWKQYCNENGKFDYDMWRREFDKEIHGYKRTFNIVSYGVHPEDLRKISMLSYQPEQTLNFTIEEIEMEMSRGLTIYEVISRYPEAFLKYRGLIKLDDENQEECENIDDYTPPYYRALLKNPDLFYDEYVRSKIDEDINKLRNNILAGKLFVDGNYQVFMPDLYALAEWSFHSELGREPEGLLKEPYHIYSSYWNRRNITEIDIIRNPHVGMEHRIGRLQKNVELEKWFKYQQTGIVSGMYDTLALALNGADYDGDTVLTVCDLSMINAAKRELETGHGRLVIKKVKDSSATSAEKSGVEIKNRKKLMEVNQMSFKNSIGTVINKITDLWSMVNDTNYDESIIRNYIDIGVIVGSETIDFAKTGENAVFPKDVKNFISQKKKAYWMRYMPKFLTKAREEEEAVRQAKLRGATLEEIEDIKLFTDYECNMNRLSHYAEQKIFSPVYDIESGENEKIFDHRKQLLKNDPPINKNVLEKVKELQDEYYDLAVHYRKECLKSKEHQRSAANRFHWFYNRCRNELLYIEPDINKLVDMLVKIYYADFRNGSDFIGKQKDILWNAFPEEMIARCSGTDINTSIDTAKLEKYHQKNVKYKKASKEKHANKKKVVINSIEENAAYQKTVVQLTTGDRKAINELIDNAYKNKRITRKDNIYKLKRISAVLIFLSRKMESNQLQWLEKRNNVPDELTDRALEKLTGINHKYMDAAFVLLEELGLIVRHKKDIYGKIKFKVQFEHFTGDPWIETDDYNNAGTKIRDYFRK